MSIELTLPGSMSSMFIVEPLVLNKRVDGPLIYYGEFIRCAALVYLGYAIQSYMVYMIFLMDVDCAMEVPEKAAILEFVCVFVFEISMFVEVRNAANIVHLLWMAPTTSFGLEFILGEASTNSGSARENARGAVMTEGEVGWMHSQVRRVRGKKAEDTAQWSLKNMSEVYKAWSLLAIAGPKLLIGVCLALVGGIWIPQSPTPEDLILNTLAMNFIVDIDPLMYGAFTSEAAKEDLDHMTPIPHKITNKGRKTLWAMNAFVYPLLVLLVSWGVVQLSKKVAACAGETE